MHLGQSQFGVVAELLAHTAAAVVGCIGTAALLQLLHFAVTVVQAESVLLTRVLDVDGFKVEQAIEALVLGAATGQGRFLGCSPAVLVDADRALTGNAHALQFTVRAVAVVDLGAVGPGEAALFAR